MVRRPAGRPGTDLAAQARAWVDASCREQGLPVKVNDPRVLSATAELLAEREKRAALGAPDRLEAFRVEAVVAAPG